MDTPRRWQVGSTVTALAGLGLGAVLLSRPSIEPVEPIRLIVADAPSDGAGSGGAGRTSSPDVVVELPDAEGLTIVPPVVMEDPPGSPAEASVVTVASVASADEDDDGSSASTSTTTTTSTSRSSTTSSSTSSGVSSTPAPAPRTTAPPADDSPDSVDSADADDSDD